jgi:hypothetical protein
METSRIIQLAQSIASNTAFIDGYIRENNLPQPSFEADGPSAFLEDATAETKKAKNNTIEALIELKQLLEGPMKLLLPEVRVSNQTIPRWEI